MRPGPGAIAAFGGSPLRVAALNTLLREGEASTEQVAASLGTTQNAVRRQLLALESAGLVGMRRATHPRGLGGITYWRTDRDRVEDTIDDLVTEVFRNVAY